MENNKKNPTACRDCLTILGDVVAVFEADP